MVADRVLTLALVVLSGVAVLGRSSRRGSCGSTCRRPTRPTRRRRSSWERSSSDGSCRRSCSTGVGAVATGLLQAERKFAAPMFAPILNNLCVIATFGDLRAAGRWRNDLRREHHVPREDRPRGRDHVRRGRDDAGAVAVAPEPRLPLASPVRLEPPGGATAGQARAVGRRLRRGEPGGLRRDHGVHRQVRRRLPDLRERVHPLPASARDRGRVDLHRAPAADVRPMGRTRHRRAPRVVLPRGARHDRRHRAGGARLPGARRPHREPAPATRPRRRERRREHRTHPAGVRARACRSSRRSNC